MSKITPAAALRCATHTLADQLAQLRELERQRVISESVERIMRDDEELHPHPLYMPIDED